MALYVPELKEFALQALARYREQNCDVTMKRGELECFIGRISPTFYSFVIHNTTIAGDTASRVMQYIGARDTEEIEEFIKTGRIERAPGKYQA